MGLTIVLGHRLQLMELHKLFGQNVRKARKTAGYSQEEFADLAQIARSYISDIERGKYSPSLTVVDRIAKVLGIAPGRLLDADVDTKSLKTKVR